MAVLLGVSNMLWLRLGAALRKMHRMLRNVVVKKTRLTSASDKKHMENIVIAYSSRRLRLRWYCSGTFTVCTFVYAQPHLR